MEGASTITQQYIKNAYLSQDRSLSRKKKEAAIAVEVEHRYEKDEILGMYLNTVLAGSLSVYTTLDLGAQVTARETLYGPNG